MEHSQEQQNSNSVDAPSKSIKEKKEGTMIAAFVQEYGKPLIIKETSIPKPQNGEVLIKVEGAPINPSDLEILKGVVNHMPALPYQLGVEGSGTVISSGGGLMARAMVGKRVSFATQPGKSGSWAEYAIAPAQFCCPLDNNVSFDQGACGIVNPFTAIAFLEVIKREKYKAIVQNAAASQLGRMIIKLLKSEGVKVINVVRKPEQVKLLKEEGADIILNSEDKTFEEELRKKAFELQATCLLEPVCGEKTHQMLRALPPESTCYIYGHLSHEELTHIDFNDLLTQNKTIKSFMVNNWLNNQGIFTKISVVRRVQKMLAHDLRSVIAKTFHIEEINNALKYYCDHMTEGKVLIKSSN